MCILVGTRGHSVFAARITLPPSRGENEYNDSLVANDMGTEQEVRCVPGLWTGRNGNSPPPLMY